MTRTECILAHITYELDQRQREIDNENYLLEIHLRVKFDKYKDVEGIQYSKYTERSVKKKAA